MPLRVRLSAGWTKPNAEFQNASHLLPTLGRPNAVALHFARCEQLAARLAPTGVRPCREHANKRTEKRLRATYPYSLDRTRYAAKSEHLWMVASSLWSASLAMAVS